MEWLINRLTIIGNLTRDPELRTTSAGVSVCDFTVAVNRRNKSKEQNGQNEADFFHVTVWRERGEACGKCLAKGRKVCVVGPVTVRTYQTNKGETRASLEVTAEEVEFLSGKGEKEQAEVDPQSGYEKVQPDDLPY